MLTMVVPEGAGIGGTGYLQIVKVCNYQVAYSERRHSIYKSKIQVSILPSPDISIYNTYVQVVQYIPVVYAVVLQRSFNTTAVVINIQRVYTGHILITQFAYFTPQLLACICKAYASCVTSYSLFIKYCNSAFKIPLTYILHQKIYQYMHCICTSSTGSEAEQGHKVKFEVLTLLNFLTLPSFSMTSPSCKPLIINYFTSLLYQ